MKKVAVVTGASAGIGAATVKRLIEQSYTTYAAARRLERMANLEKLGATLLPLDLTYDSSIVAAAERIRMNKAASMSSSTTPATAHMERWKTSPSTKRAASSRSMSSALPALSSWPRLSCGSSGRERS
jgi:NADP-dependent 3-hydroxy acid dehydrogenase YdfG